MEISVVSDRSAEVLSRLAKEIQSAEMDLANNAAEGAQASIRAGKKTGRFYNRKPRGRYQASAPGESPANVSGALADSIAAVKTEDGAEVVATDPIAHTMEFGTAGGKIKPRPFMTPEAEKMQRDAAQAIAEAIRKVTG